MKKFRVAIAYEEGFHFEVEADTEKDAENKALKITQDYGGFSFCDEKVAKEYYLKTVHRDFHSVQVDSVGGK